MEIRSTQSFNAIPATIIRGVFNLYISIVYVKCIVNILFIFSFIFSFLFNHCKFFSGKFVHTYIHE